MHANSNTKKVKLTLIGKEGKMGTLLTRMIQEDPQFELVSSNCDVVIDFSAPEGTQKALSMGKPLVCGTTGLSEELMSELHQLSKKVAVLYSPNFSIGIALCFEILENLREKLKKFSSIEIEEVHHTQKKDAPSGTALKMAQILGIDTSSIKWKRADEVVGTHEIKFLFAEEQISLKHEAFSRKAFAQGALLAAKFIFNKPAKLYRINEVFS